MSDVVPVESDRCGLDDLFRDYGTAAARAGLGLGPGWPRRWTAGWRTSDGELACAVRDLGEVPAAGCVPVRRFTWRQRQRHRPGLQFMVSTGRLHGFESLEERSRLALDYTGMVEEILPQPFRLRFGSAPARSASMSRISWRCSATVPGGCSTSGPRSWSGKRTRDVLRRSGGSGAGGGVTVPHEVPSSD